VYSTTADTPKAAGISARTSINGPQGRLILKIAADKINTPRSRGRR
jgi:hypothetical protein